MPDFPETRSSSKAPRAIGAALFLLLAVLVAALWLGNGRAQDPIVIAQPAETARRLFVEPSAAPGADAGRPVFTVLNVRRAMNYGDYLWDDKGVKPGVSWVRIDLDAQIMSVFRGGHEIGTAVILHGADAKPTPVGRFPVIAKLKDHRSSIYDAAMPYTLRLTDDGVAIHGSNVRPGLATNGCIGIPEAFASKLFDEIAKGAQVEILSAGSGDPPSV